MRIGCRNLTVMDFYDIIKKAVKTDNNQALTAINKNFNYKYIIRVYTKVGIDPMLRNYPLTRCYHPNKRKGLGWIFYYLVITKHLVYHFQNLFCYLFYVFPVYTAIGHWQINQLFP